MKYYSEMLDKLFDSVEEIDVAEAEAKKAEAAKKEELANAEKQKEADKLMLEELYGDYLDAVDVYKEVANEYFTAKRELLKKYGFVKVTADDEEIHAELGEKTGDNSFFGKDKETLSELWDSLLSVFD